MDARLRERLENGERLMERGAGRADQIEELVQDRGRRGVLDDRERLVDRRADPRADVEELMERGDRDDGRPDGWRNPSAG